MNLFYSYFILINIFSFALFGIDKHKAKHRQWRIPESMLLGTALVGGGLGALLGMQCFRHKTKHVKFLIVIPLCLIFHIFFAGILISHL